MICMDWRQPALCQATRHASASGRTPLNPRRACTYYGGYRVIGGTEDGYRTDSHSRQAWEAPDVAPASPAARLLYTATHSAVLPNRPAFPSHVASKLAQKFSLTKQPAWRNWYGNGWRTLSRMHADGPNMSTAHLTSTVPLAARQHGHQERCVERRSGGTESASISWLRPPRPPPPMHTGPLARCSLQAAPFFRLAGGPTTTLAVWPPLRGTRNYTQCKSRKLKGRNCGFDFNPQPPHTLAAPTAVWTDVPERGLAVVGGGGWFPIRAGSDKAMLVR